MAVQSIQRGGDTRGTGQTLIKPCLGKKEVKLFVTLFHKIKEKVGGYRAAMKEIGIGGSTTDKMLKDGRLTADMGRRILDCYNRVK